MLKIPGVSGIRGQIMLMMVAIALIPVIITGVILYDKTSENINIEVSEKMESLEKAVSYDTTHLVMLRQEQAKVIAGTFLPKQMSSDGTHDQELLTRIQGHIESIADEIHQVPTSDYDMIDTRSAIAIIGTWDKNGEIVANTNTELIGKQMPAELMRGVAEKGTHFGGFINDPLTNENFLIILEEIRNWEDGELAGPVLLKVHAQILNMIVSGEHIRTGEIGEMYLLNRDHYMITESRFVDDAILNQQVNTEFVDACFNGESNQGTYTNYMGYEVFGSAMYLPDQDWCIVTEVSTEEAFASATQIQTYTMYIAVIAAVLIGVVSFMAAKGIVRSIMKPVVRVSKIDEKISKGDLTENVEKSKSNDELGTLTNAIYNMTKNLRTLIGDTRSIATTVVKDANSVAASTEELNSGVEQVSSTVQQISTGSQSQASDLSDAKTIVDSVTNNTDGTSASDKMQRIVELTKDSSEKVRGLAEKSAKITDVVEVIRGIAEKTNLLALNAAIEAARAGESGRGFAVVADEVRRLAEGSAKSSQEIDDLLREIQDEIKSTVTGIDESAQEVEAGREVVEKSLQALENIGKKVQEISAVSEQNAAASEEASASVEQQTAATEDISTSSQSMASLAGDLERKVAQFKLQESDGNGAATTNTSSSKPKKRSFKDRIVQKKEESIDDLVQIVEED